MRRDEMMEGALKVEEVEQKRRWKSMVGGFFVTFLFLWRGEFAWSAVLLLPRAVQETQEPKSRIKWRLARGGGAKPAVPPGRPHYVTRVLWSANKPIMSKKTLALAFDVGSRSVKAQLKCSKSKNKLCSEGLDFTQRCRILRCRLTVVIVRLLWIILWMSACHSWLAGPRARCLTQMLNQVLFMISATIKFYLLTVKSN